MQRGKPRAPRLADAWSSAARKQSAHFSSDIDTLLASMVIVVNKTCPRAGDVLLREPLFAHARDPLFDQVRMEGIADVVVRCFSFGMAAPIQTSPCGSAPLPRASAFLGVVRLLRRKPPRNVR